MLLSDKYDLEKDNFFNVSNLDEAIEVANYLEENGSNPAVVYDTEDGYTVARKLYYKGVDAVISYGIRVNFKVWDKNRFYIIDHNREYDSSKPLTKEELLNLIERADIEWEEILEGDDF